MGRASRVGDGLSHRRIFPARRDALPQVEAFLAEVCAAAGLDRAMCLRVTLLVEELFTNTVVHGHGADSDAPVRLDCEVAPGRITLVYEDTGPPHDPFAVVASPDPDAQCRTARWAGSACSSSPPWPGTWNTGGPTTGIASRSCSAPPRHPARSLLPSPAEVSP